MLLFRVCRRYRRTKVNGRRWHFVLQIECWNPEKPCWRSALGPLRASCSQNPDLVTVFSPRQGDGRARLRVESLVVLSIPQIERSHTGSGKNQPTAVSDARSGSLTLDRSALGRPLAQLTVVGAGHTEHTVRYTIFLSAILASYAGPECHCATVKYL